MSFLRDAAVDMVVSLKGYSLSKDAEIALHRLKTEIVRSQEVENMINKRKHSCPDWDYMVIDEDSPEYEACLCFPEIECTDEQLIEEVRRRGFVIRNAKIHRKWVGITCEEIDEIYRTGWFDVHYDLAFAIEAKLKEKNT